MIRLYLSFSEVCTIVTISPVQDALFEKQLLNLAHQIKSSRHLVIFTGAGISTNSGLPDYRGRDGVWTRRRKGLSDKKVKPFSKFKPSNGHKAIYQLYKKGHLKFLVTQNIDNLHHKSGIPETHLAEIHGNYNKLRCLSCDRRYTLKECNFNNNLPSLTNPTAGISNPKSCSCGGQVVPTYVNFGRPLLDKELQLANDHASKSDLFIAIGTTLNVEPASLLPKKAKNNGAYIVIINNDRTAYDLKADLIIQGQIEDILPKLVSYVKRKST